MGRLEIATVKTCGGQGKIGSCACDLVLFEPRVGNFARTILFL